MFSFFHFIDRKINIYHIFVHKRQIINSENDFSRCIVNMTTLNRWVSHIYYFFRLSVLCHFIEKLLFWIWIIPDNPSKYYRLFRSTRISIKQICIFLLYVRGMKMMENNMLKQIDTHIEVSWQFFLAYVSTIQLHR